MSNQEPKSIIKDKELKHSIDFNFLKRTGIAEIQKLSGKIWTDYNEHDPGVTILENICYALTELGFKTDFSIKDLFFKISEEGESEFLKTFYSPLDILPPAPTTVIDFRKTLIDQINELRNVWIVPKKQSTIGTRINGLYEVLVMVNPDSFNHDDIKQQVKDVLHKNRNLGEDFEEVKILDFENVHFKANISIAPDAIGESVYAEILNVVQENFTPNIPLYSQAEVLDMGYSYEYIHDHPQAVNGYVIEEDLLNSELHHINKIFKSNLIRLISEVEGVNEVYNLSLYIADDLVTNEIIQLSENKIPLLQTEKMIDEGTISLFAGDIAYVADKNVIKYTYEVEKSKHAVKHNRFIERNDTEIKSSMKKEDLKKYYSIQNSFPRTYGITDFGIQGKVSEAREAQVKQLRAYLFFYEQIMSNFLAQLANVDQLFSTKKHLNHTYFYQHLKHINGYKDLIITPEGSDEIPLADINEKFDRVKERRNMFLDHMLARFGEEFLMEAYNAIHRESSSVAKTNFLDQSIEAKCQFLNNYVDISRNKSKGYDHTSDYKESENVSGLEKKISLLFNFKQYGYKKLSDIKSESSLSMGNKESKPTNSTISFNSKDPNLFADILAFGSDRNNYRIEKQGKKYSLSYDNPLNGELIPIYVAPTIKECEDATTKLIEKISVYNQKSEGFHILEHILLRDINSSFRYIYISEGNIELTSPFEYTESQSDRMDFISELLEIGTSKSNYSVKKYGDYYKLLLSKKGLPFQVTSSEFLDKQSAELAIEDLIEELKQTDIDDDDLDLRMHLDQDMSNVAVYDEDPYSLQISFVCPHWSGRFRSEKMKYLFENVVKLNAPAHLKINFLWLKLEEMTEFEGYYERWLDIKTNDSSNRKKLDKLSKVLLLLLKKYNEGEDKALAKELKTARDSVK